MTIHPRVLRIFPCPLRKNSTMLKPHGTLAWWNITKRECSLFMRGGRKTLKTYSSVENYIIPSSPKQNYKLFPFYRQRLLPAVPSPCTPPCHIYPCSTPPFPPDSFLWCSLSDDYQTIVGCPTRHLSTPTRHLSDKYHTCTICPPDIFCAICTSDVHQTYTRHPPHICQMYGICLVYKWYLSDRCLVRHLTGIWQSSDNHLTGSTRQIATVWRKRWCNAN